MPLGPDFRGDTNSPAFKTRPWGDVWMTNLYQGRPRRICANKLGKGSERQLWVFSWGFCRKTRNFNGNTGAYLFLRIPSAPPDLEGPTRGPFICNFFRPLRNSSASPLLPIQISKTNWPSVSAGRSRILAASSFQFAQTLKKSKSCASTNASSSGLKPGSPAICPLEDSITVSLALLIKAFSASLSATRK